MDVRCVSQTLNAYGGSAIYSYVGHLLTVRLIDCGTAVDRIEIISCLRSSTQYRKALKQTQEQFNEYTTTLPRVTFRRKLKQVEIEFLSGHFVAEDDRGWKPSAKKCNIAAEEVLAVLPLIRSRIKPEDDFETERFLRDVTNILSTKIESMEEWEEIRQAATDKQKAESVTKSPWELLEIEWDQYHPQARDILDEPFFWEGANDLAPNGNDTGADLLEDYLRWDKRNPDTSPLEFLEELIKEWQVQPIDWTVTDEQTVRRYRRETPIALSVCNEAAIGLAFAVIKMRVLCPEDVVERALAALTRTAVVVHDSTLSDEVKSEWNSAITMMQEKLNSLN